MNEIIYVKHLKYTVQDKLLNLLLLPFLPPTFRKHMTVIDSEDSQMEETGKSTSSGLKIFEYLQSQIGNMIAMVEANLRDGRTESR